ncbi:MAG: carboxynorspermidine decarboxylase [Methylococcales bacterium]|nr:carboxynorspermidine decarboxylase [Methylococcales bacterium]
MSLKTPAFVLNETQLLENLTTLASISKQSGCKILYAMKALPSAKVLEIAKPFVDGFAVSSLFEATLAREILAGEGEVHLTTPALIAEELYELATLCSHINFNSLTQHNRYAAAVENETSVGLRVNPKLSFVSDDRFNPCRRYSKLGIDIDALWHSNQIEQVSGLHFHTVFSATDFKPLIQTVEKLRSYFGQSLKKLKWINFGGGYLFHSIQDHQPFIDLVIDLRRELGVECYLEIGNGVVGNAAQMIASVIDVFESDGKTIAILDTSINHNPEVFEYQRSPTVLQHHENGRFNVILAGGTCLAGDVFGEYRFQHPLQIGDKITFENVGAYTLIKANRFNGHNFPSIYVQRTSGELELVKNYNYQDYQQQWT